MSDKIKFSADQLVSATHLVRNFSKHLDMALKKPLFIQRNNEVEFVLISFKRYKRIAGKEGEE